TGHVVVRLQGVDAPEVHYRPISVLRRAVWTPEQTALFATWCVEYRQPVWRRGSRRRRTGGSASS
ncbi:MAG TPA: hypothetical protein VF316_02570, partial [Polyangiaceae bacterium]